MSEHTKEPWRLGKASSVVADEPVIGMNGSDAVEYYGGHLICESVVPSNASRIVACVNACDGMDDPSDAIAMLQSQRDELLAAAKRVVFYGPTMDDGMILLRAAIAKADKDK